MQPMRCPQSNSGGSEPASRTPHEPLWPAEEMSGRFHDSKSRDRVRLFFADAQLTPTVYASGLGLHHVRSGSYLTQETSAPICERMATSTSTFCISVPASAICHVQDRSLPFEEGDLAVIGSGTASPDRMSNFDTLPDTTLFFSNPDLIRCDNEAKAPNT